MRAYVCVLSEVESDTNSCETFVYVIYNHDKGVKRSHITTRYICIINPMPRL